ncbi:BREX-1 system adenine-specific DNA-methyltransferase PglX [Thalassolituus marinus]|uniref:site-specific DNA-methyltransferase (adenine-specific) n=1 Tax=Thalassolituus marinus TaxID=671053 RepID=A0ABS7ZYC7_9GAMM|nr:BREX-1 system adenine-specific DNA-methyltransferase PglX [Thalassolituus marinus]MCA6065375.1 BREX-1 system adenine-specific DNA-methyltransferase PglX [Thalassolituus marinus]
MNTNNVKKYAPKARKAFIEAMSKQAAKYGITSKKVEPAEQKGDLVLIGDRPFPASVIKPRERLVKRIEQQGFDQVMEHVAYSWFNRLCAIRYMERKGFLDHGRRVLSAADGSAGVPQILEECLDVELPGLDQAKVRELKLDGTKDEELYRELLLAQCHALHQAMPFLFEAVADESELLLPENLTKTDSLIRELVASIPDEDWDHIEIIGWLYQFYISEKKDQVIGKVVKNEDIPAATQLFTPNWIVQYMVQNTVGRQWLQTYPDSPLKEKMPYYIEPAEQTSEVQARLSEITPSQITPESTKVLDSGCGSGHILIEAYKVLKAIYEERGYRTRDIPQLILENNLFGLDIDDRAGQLAGFALMMLAREDDRRIFSRNIRLNVLSLQESTNVNLPSLWRSLNLTGDWQSGASQGLFEEDQQDLSAFAADNRYQLLQKTLAQFKQAKTFGSLIDVPHDDCEELKEIFVTLRELDSSGDSMQRAAASQLLPYVHQALLLAQKYETVVANPPYMGSKYQSPDIKKELKARFSGYEKDLFSAFIIRNLQLAKDHGQLGFMTPFVWMFISSYEQLRSKLIDDEVISTLIQLEYSGFDGATVPICTFTLTKGHVPDYTGSYIRLSDFRGAANQGPKTLEAIANPECGWFYEAKPDDFKKIPGSPIAYWLPYEALRALDRTVLLGEIASPRKGMCTRDNDHFIRGWSEVSVSNIGFDIVGREESKLSKKRWFPYQKGGEFRQWYGNHFSVVDWENDGYRLLNMESLGWAGGSTNHNLDFIFGPAIVWSKITSSIPNFRYSPMGFLYDDASGMCHVTKGSDLNSILAFLCSKVGQFYMGVLNPTLNIQPGNMASMPYLEMGEKVDKDVDEIVSICRNDWDEFEISWDFVRSPLVSTSGKLGDAYSFVRKIWRERTARLKELEEIINDKFILEYGLQNVLSPEISIERVSLNCNPAYRFGSDKSEMDAENILQSSTVYELASYSIGCMMGRYSLDRESLVYARSGNEGFSDLVSEGAYKTFPADDDGIIPLTDQEWFPDDATNRFRDFVKVIWGEEHLHENLDFVAESLCLHAIKPKKSESSMDTIRRYLSTQFYKDHLKTYKKRPIYWLFSSGKQKAFECLVYLHRYNEGTLARMRTEYVIPLTAKMAAYAQKLENDKEASGSAAEVKRLEKEIAQLHKQQAELSEFDEKLRHYADQRISLDLDDGVKANYGKFGDLLAEVKAITGEAPEALS